MAKLASLTTTPTSLSRAVCHQSLFSMSQAKTLHFRLRLCLPDLAICKRHHHALALESGIGTGRRNSPTILHWVTSELGKTCKVCLGNQYCFQCTPDTDVRRTGMTRSTIEPAFFYCGSRRRTVPRRTGCQPAIVDLENPNSTAQPELRYRNKMVMDTAQSEQ